MKANSTYERKMIVPVEELLPKINGSFSLRMRTYAKKGIVCVSCGLKGSYFALEKHRKDKSPKTITSTPLTRMEKK